MDPSLSYTQAFSIRKRRHLPSKARTLKYCTFATMIFVLVAFLHQQSTSLLASKYSSVPVEGATSMTQSSYKENSLNNSDIFTVKMPSSNLYPRFGKCTASFGDLDPIYEAAISSHILHNTLHNYSHYILRERMIRGLWSKHGFLLTIIGQELSKPKDQRLQWLMWHDRDTVLMNPQIPLHVFVPPEPDFANINLLVTNDRNGLNNGVFMVRVGQWAFKLFASALSIREYQPEIPLKYTEQSGMEETIKRPWWASSVAYVPQRWFNGFPPDSDVGNDHSRTHARQGTLLIHFASNRDGLRPERLAHWGGIAQNRTVEWDKPIEETWYLEEVAEFWERVRKGEPYEKINKDIEGRAWTTPKLYISDGNQE